MDFVSQSEGYRTTITEADDLLTAVQYNHLFHTVKEEEQSACSDGTFGGERYFTCPAGRGFFTLLEHCRQDSRFAPNTPNSDTSFHAEKGYYIFLC